MYFVLFRSKAFSPKALRSKAILPLDIAVDPRCKYYDAWFCNGELICTDEPCDGKCPKSAGPKEEEFYLCDGSCRPISSACDGNKCPKGMFRCGSRCLSPKQVRKRTR